MNGFKIITSISQFGDFMKDLSETEYIAYDIESDGLDFLSSTIRLAQYKLNGNIYILDLENKTDDRIFTHATKLIEGSGKVIISHNSKFELKFTLRNAGILLTKIYDTQLGERIITAGIGKKFSSLNSLTHFYCGYEMEKETRMDFVNSPVITQEMYMYAALDVEYLEYIMKFQRIEAENLKMSKVMDLEMALLPVVARMEYDGVLLASEQWLSLYERNVKGKEEAEKFLRDGLVDLLSSETLFENALVAFKFFSIPTKSLSKKRKTELEEITNLTDIKEEVRKTWNPNSHVQIKRALNLKGYPLESTGQSILNNWSGESYIKALIDLRFYGKRCESFGETWLEHIHSETGRIHPQFNQCGTATGRWSSDGPNMQNIIADEEYRSCFIARPGYKLITVDYSQAELRLIGAVANERNIIEAYLNGEDIHAKTASLMYNIPIEEVTKEQRNKGKTMNFSILYGSSAKGIAGRNEDISLDEAQDMVDRFFKGYPSLSQFINLAGEVIYERRMSRTPFGRIRFFDDKTVFADSKEMFSFKSRVMREGVNHIIQGGSADALKLAIVDFYYNNPFDHDDCRILIQVHDEIVVEVRDEFVDEALEFIIGCMERGEQQFLGQIPAVADAKILDYWSK